MFLTIVEPEGGNKVQNTNRNNKKTKNNWIFNAF